MKEIEKKEDLLPVKKLPALFQKAYTEKQFKRKILNKLFIPKDKEFAASLFTDTGGKKPIVIPQGRMFTKTEAATIKRIAKQIRSQKGRVRLIPLAAVAGFIALAVIGVITFKNPLAKLGITRGLEAVFGAKCDIGSVNVKILDSSLTINSLAVANKNSTMRNLFEMERIAFDFSLTQILRGRFMAELLEVSGVQANTERKTDGALPRKRQKPADAKPNPVVNGIKNFSAGAVSRASDSVANLFTAYNPDTIVKGLFNQLKSPEAAEKIKPQMDALTGAWRDTPAQVTAQVTDIIQSGQALTAIDVNAIRNDPAKIAQAVADVTTLVNKTKNIRDDTQKLVTRIDADAKAVTQLSRDIRNALDADLKLVNGEIAKIRSFTIADGKNFFSGVFDTVLADALGKYYPYAIQGYDLAYKYLLSDEAKQKAAQKAAERETRNARRLPGRTILYRRDIPSFVIKKVMSSGRTNAFSLEVQITDITSDMERWGKPVTMQVSSAHGAMSESLIAQLDVREKRTAPLFTANFSGNGYQLNLAVPSAKDTPGIPAVSGKSAFTGKIAFNSIEEFSLEGTAQIAPASVTASSFEPAFAYQLYKNILDSFTSINAGFIAAFAPESGLDIKITSSIDETLKTALLREVNAQLAALKDNALKQAKAELDKATGGLTAQFSDFSDMQREIQNQSTKLGDYQKQLESKLAELQNSAKSQAQDQARNAASNALQNLLPRR
ncbi:MAG: TIGR03545 family protein [Treponemataceae bacterium]|nr:MAG: TIGR03545 family protein [Treponemataceae bacterium]